MHIFSVKLFRTYEGNIKFERRTSYPILALFLVVDRIPSKHPIMVGGAVAHLKVSTSQAM